MGTRFTDAYKAQFPRIEDGRLRKLAALNLAFRSGHPAVRVNPLLEDVIVSSTGHLTDLERRILANHLLRALEAEDAQG